LAAEDHRLFFPPEADWPSYPHLDGKSNQQGEFTFGELDSGVFSVAAWLPTKQDSVHYFGERSGVQVQAGATTEIELSPSDRGGNVYVRLEGTVKAPKFAPLIILSRAPGPLSLVGGSYHPEDKNLGRALAGGIRALRASGNQARFENLPEGDYILLALANIPAGSGTAQGAVHVLGERVEVKSGEREEVALKKPE
ncbi:MAG: hypothetical protein KC931_15865, partial [Candidatus Omnitrophica bacterium]|nr:hypothetical protein [Candidatus Omnitrophota bacterium]